MFVDSQEVKQSLDDFMESFGNGLDGNLWGKVNDFNGLGEKPAKRREMAKFRRNGVWHMVICGIGEKPVKTSYNALQCMKRMVPMAPSPFDRWLNSTIQPFNHSIIP